MNASKEEITARFAQWLDEALGEEPPPRGIAEEIMRELAGEGPAAGAPDLHALHATMTALAHEVRLEGRAVRGLRESLQDVERLPARIDVVQRSLERLLGTEPNASDESRERERAAAREAERHARRAALLVLVDLRERLRRTLAATETQLVRLRAAGTPSGLRMRLVAKLRESLERIEPPGSLDPDLASVLEALRDGVELAARRIDDELDGANVVELACLGRAFDPHRMVAVALADSTKGAAGSISSVFRPGYEWDGDLLRAAEVEVVATAAPAADKNGVADRARVQGG